MNRTSLPTSCLLNKSVVREALRGLVHETMDVHLPLRQVTSLEVMRALIAYGSLLYITPELLHLLERPANLPIAGPFLPYLRVLSPGRYLKRWCRRLTEENFSHEDALILSYASFGFDGIEETFGVEVVLTNDLQMNRSQPDSGSGVPAHRLTQNVDGVLAETGQGRQLCADDKRLFLTSHDPQPFRGDNLAEPQHGLLEERVLAQEFEKLLGIIRPAERPESRSLTSCQDHRV